MTRRRLPTLLVLALACASLVFGGCRSAAGPVEIARDRAIAIARKEIAFEPTSTSAQRGTSAGRHVWRVEFRGRLPGQPPMLFEVRIVEIDRVTGEIVSVSRS